MNETIEYSNYRKKRQQEATISQSEIDKARTEFLQKGGSITTLPTGYTDGYFEVRHFQSTKSGRQGAE